MTKKITIDSAGNIPIGELSELAIANLVSLQREANIKLKQAQNLKEWLDSAITLKYQNRAADIRVINNKVTGTINFADGKFNIKSVVSKRVDWDQAKLKKAISQIKESGDNPYEYVTATYKVSETKFTAWPEHIKRFFRDARILKTGKETYLIEEIKEVSHE